ncbi:gamma-glutamyltranspeptidase 1 precursor [Microthyrium microscopicum]|uniref:Glutathione hydrolase n=1 Tax=Microthyrium microscopicum TaxID=703497 RepID=A0A6A6UEK8_9PEZI|nr:gamma-glutamyltranspeptidase 1 precursor [Microthyrium microscopicum]
MINIRNVFVLLALHCLVWEADLCGAAIIGQRWVKSGAVASENKLCSQIGIDLMKAGGNAVDAAIGTQLCTGTVAMYHSGIGGGGFALVRGSNGSYEMVDFREIAPAAAYQDMYDGNYNGSLIGGLAVGVPGELRGFEYMSNKYGNLEWRDLFTPSIKLAKDGFIIDQDLYSRMQGATFLQTDPAWAADFAPNGTLLGLGDTLKRTRFADTLETIALEGADAFYAGSIAETTVAATQAHNGTMVVEDLNDYKVKIRPTIEITYRGFKVTSCTAPSSGPVVLSAMKLIEGYSDIGEPSLKNLSTHRADEALKFAYGQRLYLADPYFVAGMPEFEDEMINATTAAANRAKISDTQTQNISYYDPAGLVLPVDSGTSHMVAADSNGMVVSMTSTVNAYFGSTVMVPETGIVLNDEMNDFSIPGTSNEFGYISSPENYIKPGKTPLSSMTPTIVEHLDNSTFYFATGAAGGSRIITAIFESLWYVLDWNMTPQEALDQPRFHDQLVPPVVSFDYSFDNSTVAYIKSLGSNVSWTAPGGSTAQAVRQLWNGTFQPAHDPSQVDGAGLAF